MKKEIGRLVIDVNIWVKWAAHKRIGIWLESFGEFGIEIFGSSMLIEELDDVLQRPFFKKLSGKQLNTSLIVKEISKVITLVDYENISFRCPDPDDEYLIEVAFKANAILVSNDKFLLDWKESPVKIISLDHLRTSMNELLSRI